MCIRTLDRLIKKAQIQRLKDKGHGLGKRRIGHTVKEPVVHAVQRKRLLHVVPQLMHCDIEALVVHALRANAGTQSCVVALALRTHGVPATTRGVDLDATGQPGGPLLSKPQLGQHRRQG